jgi:chemotaxis protein CheD
MTGSEFEIAVGMADIKIGKDPQVLTTVLGSCVGLCLYSPQQKVGGLLHLMMPSAGEMAVRPDLKKAKYADTGVAELIRTIRAMHNIQPSDLVAKMFGGAKVLQGVQRNIGQENINAVKDILKTCGIPVKASCVGGERGYRIKFSLDTGKVNCQIFGNQPEDF